MANVVQPKVYTLGVSTVDCDALETLGMPVTLATEPVEDLVELSLIHISEPTRPY